MHESFGSMFCSNCGHPDEKGKFCSSCGMKLVTDVSGTKDTPTGTDDVSQEETLPSAPKQEDGPAESEAIPSTVKDGAANAKESAPKLGAKANVKATPESKKSLKSKRKPWFFRLFEWFFRLSLWQKLTAVALTIAVLGAGVVGVGFLVSEQTRELANSEALESRQAWFDWRIELRASKQATQASIDAAIAADTLAEGWGDIEPKRATLQERIRKAAEAMGANDLTAMSESKALLDAATKAIGTQADADERARQRAELEEQSRKSLAKGWANKLGPDIISNRCTSNVGGGRYYFWSFGRWDGGDMIWSISSDRNGVGLVQAIRFTDMGGYWQIGPTDESPVENDPFNNIGYPELSCKTWTASQ